MGGNRKLNYNRPPEHRTATNSEQGLPHYVRPTSTCRKVTKKEIIRRLSVVASSCRDVEQQNQVTLAVNRSLTKKVAKSKEVSEGLRMCLNQCRRQVRSTKHDLVKALQDNVATKNDALSQEQEHQSLIAAMEKDAQATLEQVKRGHSLSMAKIISKSESKLAATEMKHKRAESITEMKHKRVVNNIEIEHKREVNIITKRDRVTINAKENLHALELEIKSNEINVSPPFHIVAFLPSFTHTTFLQELIKKHDTQKCRDKKLHRKQQVAKDKKYARLLAAKEVKHAKRQAANKALIAKGIEMTRSIAQASFTRSVNANFDHATFIAAWAKVLRNRPDLAAHQHVGVALIIESKYGSALPVFKDPDQLKIADLAALVASTTDAAKNGKVPVAMLSGATTTVFDLTTYSMSSATPLLFPNQVTSVTIGYESATTKIVSLTIDLNFCDFYDGALLLDALVASL